MSDYNRFLEQRYKKFKDASKRLRNKELYLSIRIKGEKNPIETIKINSLRNLIYHGKWWLKDISIKLENKKHEQ